MSESRCLGREVPVFSEKEVSIYSERRKQVEKMLTSFLEYLYMFSLITYIVIVPKRKKEGFLSGCPPEMNMLKKIKGKHQD